MLLGLSTVDLVTFSSPVCRDVLIRDEAEWNIRSIAVSCAFSSFVSIRFFLMFLSFSFLLSFFLSFFFFSSFFLSSFLPFAASGVAEDLLSLRNGKRKGGDDPFVSEGVYFHLEKCPYEISSLQAEAALAGDVGRGNTIELLDHGRGETITLTVTLTQC